ncbi:hypothetical protein L596_030491 [Steinernema carpocapsae]|uniref:Uncharacterized protein n=1 Tax=Steinernema carpocapsae TaxID=34508 RepID=A0A4V5ZWZ2_STECR|nr:hypothetical protein L596_030491 [Steinernema carpocapsae]
MWDFDNKSDGSSLKFDDLAYAIREHKTHAPSKMPRFKYGLFRESVLHRKVEVRHFIGYANAIMQDAKLQCDAFEHTLKLKLALHNYLENPDNRNHHEELEQMCVRFDPLSVQITLKLLCSV